jgi:hypothetical protein
MLVKQTELSRELAIESNLFMFNNKLYERLYDHDYKYRFFIDQNNYDYTNELK